MMQITDEIDTNTGVLYGIIDDVSEYGYFALRNGPIIKVRLSDFTIVSSLDIPMTWTGQFALDKTRNYLYKFGNNTVLYRINLSDFSVDKSIYVCLPEGGSSCSEPPGPPACETMIWAIAIDPIENYLYGAYPGSVWCAYWPDNAWVWKISLDDTTFGEVVGYVPTYYPNSFYLLGDIDIVGRRYYAVTDTWNASMIKINLETFTSEGSIVFNDVYAEYLALDSINGHAYVVYNFYHTNDRPTLVKIRLGDMTIVDTVTFDRTDWIWVESVYNPQRTNYIYVPSAYARGHTKLYKISKDPLQIVEMLDVYGGNWANVILSDKRGNIYLATSNGASPDKIFKISSGEPIIEPVCVIKRDEGIYSKPKYCYIGEGILKKRG